jgi:hypothetical protein
MNNQALPNARTPNRRNWSPSYDEKAIFSKPAYTSYETPLEKYSRSFIEGVRSGINDFD